VNNENNLNLQEDGVGKDEKDIIHHSNRAGFIGWIFETLFFERSQGEMGCS
jgi:hypothetical protein